MTPPYPAYTREIDHALWCRCGTDKTPIPCIGGCGYLCQLLPRDTLLLRTAAAPDVFENNVEDLL